MSAFGGLDEKIRDNGYIPYDKRMVCLRQTESGDGVKIINASATLFTVLAFLTLGSLLLMVGLHLLSVEDAVLRIREIYSNPWRSLQTGAVGLLFIFVGLTFAKMFVKRGRETEAIIFQGEMGPIVISITTIEDMVKKVLRRFSLIKEWKVKAVIEGRDIEIKLRLVLWSGENVPSLLGAIQQEVRDRIRKIIGPEGRLEILCDVIRVEESELGMEEKTVNI